MGSAPLVLALALAASPGDVPPAVTAASPTQALRFELGLFSAIGSVGITYTYAPSPFMLEVGVGYGFSGLQLSGMPKLALGSRSHRFVVGAGFSVGIPGVIIVITDPQHGNVDERRVAPWVNAEVGYDYRSDSGFSFAIAAGVTKPLMHGCAKGIDQCVELRDFALPQLRFGFGRWF